MSDAPDYKSTLNLPKTDFPMKANLPKREPDCIARWQKEDLYGQIRKAREGKPSFILHDGPPYANGDIHIGHVFNKTLKDIVVRYKTLRGFDAPYIPGWDCHGMPIEHQLFKELKLTKHQIEQSVFRKKAHAYAQKYVGIQREQFKRLGILGDWEHPYLTMDQDYELTIIRVFRELVEAGRIYRGKKPVYWCVTCETALAEAEVEYKDRTDTSIYVAFPVTTPAGGDGDSNLWKDARVAVWTTTPWTLPANVALAFHPESDYSLMRVKDSKGAEQSLLLATNLSATVLSKLSLTIIEELWKGSGKKFAREVRTDGGLKAAQPFGRSDSIAVTDPDVSLEEGTGIVHIAPGHGHQDYLIGQRFGLEVFSPVDHQGRYTQDVSKWAGETVFKANPEIIEDLRTRGLLLHEEPIQHSYPHCWRCKRSLIFRATPQWFLEVTEALRKELLKQAKTVKWVPAAGASRMAGMLESRPDWCLSRQRYWGTPIPVLRCAPCGEPLLEVSVIKEVEEFLKKKGLESWFTASAKELAPKARCPKCKGDALEKETDILDVWFDSGVSHEAVLKGRGLSWPADLYLEGSDQHRGWFQVSLIPSVALRGRPPFKAVLTHGFVMGGEGKKMSKSLGNVISPQEVMKQHGADILRLWVASTDYREDVRISKAILDQSADAYRKIRNTFRYLLGNLGDFNPERDRQPLDSYPAIDRWASQRLQEILKRCTEAYEGYRFHEVFRAVYQFCVVDLSSFYLDSVKDRLYTDSKGSVRRRCAQTVLYDILKTLTIILAPILAITTEEVWQLLREAGSVKEPSVHLAAWPSPESSKESPQIQKQWDIFLAVRNVVMKALEEQRAQQVIRASLEAEVTLIVKDKELRGLFEAHRDTLAEAFVVSSVSISEEGVNSGTTPVPGLAAVKVRKASGEKCRRCWKHLTEVGSKAGYPELCVRCVQVVSAEAMNP